MVGRLAIATLCLSAGAAHADKAPSAKVSARDEVDVAELKPQLVITHDGRGHYLATTKFGDTSMTFYGNGKVFYQLRVRGGGSDEGAGTSSRSFWAGNTPGIWAEVSLDAAGTWKVQCQARETPLVVLDEIETRKVLDRAVFKKMYFKRQAHALGRDDNGVYYYVDRLRADPYATEEQPTGFRLFVGRKGRLKLQRLTDSDHDSKGVVLHSRKGKLSVDFEGQKAVWTKGKKRVELIYLPVEDNVTMIYRDFGVYGKLGTPCDVM